MAGRPDIESIIVPAERSPGYKNWIATGSNILKEALPFEGPTDFAITLGTGLGPIAKKISFTRSVTIPYEHAGLPVGQVEGHKKEIIGGLAYGGKKIILINGRTHAYEIPEEGIETETWGKLSRMELATGYLAMLAEVGVENMVLMSAAGGINHPLHSDQPKPFNQEDLPVIGLIASDLNLAYPSPQMGPYGGFSMSRFVNLKGADPELQAAFKRSMKAVSPKTTVPDLHYVTSPSTPSFEDPAVIYTVAKLGGQVVGMSFSYEKEYLSGVDETKIPRFLGIALVTNLQELVDDFAVEPISVDSLQSYYPHQLKLKAQANHEEVQKYGARAADTLGKALVHFVKHV